MRISDWSSDVCSSDLPRARGLPALAGANADADPANNRLPIDNRFVTGSLNRGYGTGINFTNTRNFGFTGTVDIDLGGPALKSITAYRNLAARFGRSEERRVGKECVSKCRSRWSQDHKKKTKKKNK